VAAGIGGYNLGALTPSRAFRIIVAVALTIYVIVRADPAAILRAAASAHVGWIVAAVLLVLADRAINAFRWLVLLRAVAAGTRPPLAAILRIFFVSSFVGNFLPGIGGDVYRAWQLAQLGVRSSEAAASVLMDRVAGVVSMVALAAAALWLLPRADLPGLVPALAVVSALCAIAAAGIFSANAAAVAVAVADRLPSNRARRVARSLVEAIRRYADHHSALLTVVLLSLGVQALRVVQAYFLGRSLEIDQPVIVYFAFVPVVTLAMQLPITVAGLGVSQYAFERLFGSVGVPSSQSVALSILFIALGTIGNLPGGLLYLTGDGAGRPSPSSTAAGGHG
jgi:glycosyltransferase 2 family protein